MKKRKGFRKIILDDGEFQFNWAAIPNNPTLILYDEFDRKYTIPYSVWSSVPNSEEYENAGHRTWHGKHKKEACYGGWGKREAREAWRKFKTLKP